MFYWIKYCKKKMRDVINKDCCKFDKIDISDNSFDRFFYVNI